MDIAAILQDWESGLTPEEIKTKYNISDQVQFAILECFGQMPVTLAEGNIIKLVKVSRKKSPNIPPQPPPPET